MAANDTPFNGYPPEIELKLCLDSLPNSNSPLKLVTSDGVTAWVCDDASRLADVSRTSRKLCEDSLQKDGRICVAYDGPDEYRPEKRAPRATAKIVSVTEAPNATAECRVKVWSRDSATISRCSTIVEMTIASATAWLTFMEIVFIAHGDKIIGTLTITFFKPREAPHQLPSELCKIRTDKVESAIVRTFKQTCNNSDSLLIQFEGVKQAGSLKKESRVIRLSQSDSKPTFDHMINVAEGELDVLDTLCCCRNGEPIEKMEAGAWVNILCEAAWTLWNKLPGTATLETRSQLFEFLGRAGFSYASAYHSGFTHGKPVFYDEIESECGRNACPCEELEVLQGFLKDAETKLEAKVLALLRSLECGLNHYVILLHGIGGMPFTGVDLIALVDGLGALRKHATSNNAPAKFVKRLEHDISILRGIIDNGGRITALPQQMFEAGVGSTPTDLEWSEILMNRMSISSSDSSMRMVAKEIDDKGRPYIPHDRSLYEYDFL